MSVKKGGINVLLFNPPVLQLLDGPEEPVEQEVLWKQDHVVRVVPYKQVWIDQEDAQVSVER